MNKNDLYHLTYAINGAALEVHRFLGNSLLESVYQVCLEEELISRGVSFQKEMPVQIQYRTRILDTKLRCDFFVENCIVVETKALSDFTSSHQAQVLTYMKLLKAPKGILYNFGAANLLREGQQTFVNDYFRKLE
jgi:GxxExxY protein